MSLFYQYFFKFRMLHSYYTLGYGKDFKIVPLPRTDALIKRHKLIYKERENGPHLQRGWEVKFETPNQSILKNIGIAIGWLMCNRQGLPLFIHPVTWQEGDHKEELNAHQNYAFFIDKLPELWLDFFSNKIADKVK